MSYLEVFGVLTGVGVDVSKFFWVGAGAGVLKRGAGAELESEKDDSAHLWYEAVSLNAVMTHESQRLYRKATFSKGFL